MRAGRSQVVKTRWKARRPAERMGVPGEGLFPSAIWARRLGEWLRRRLVFFAVLVLLGWTARFLLTSPAFEVREVTVEGHQLLKADEIVLAAGLYPQSVFTLDRGQVEAAVEKLPTVQRAEVSLALPDRLTIRVHEWQPTYTWKSGSQLALVSADGVVIGVAQSDLGLLTVADDEARPLRVGDHVDLRALRTAEKLRVILPKELGISPGYYEYSAAVGIALPSYQGARIIFGWEDDLERKAASLKALLEALGRERLDVKLVDLRFRDRPYVQ